MNILIFAPHNDDEVLGVGGTIVKYAGQGHDVKPGMVGLASVRGRNNQSWDSKFKNDIEYVETVSFRADVKIFFKAIGVVLSRRDVNTEGYVSGKPFVAAEDERKRDPGEDVPF